MNEKIISILQGQEILRYEGYEILSKHELYLTGILKGLYFLSKIIFLM